MEVAWVDWYCAREALVLAMYTSSGSLEDDDDIMASVLCLEDGWSSRRRSCELSWGVEETDVMWPYTLFYVTMWPVVWISCVLSA